MDERVALLTGPGAHYVLQGDLTNHHGRLGSRTGLNTSHFTVQQLPKLADVHALELTAQSKCRQFNQVHSRIQPFRFHVPRFHFHCLATHLQHLNMVFVKNVLNNGTRITFHKRSNVHGDDQLNIFSKKSE